MKRRAKLLLPILVLVAGVAVAAVIINSKPEVERQPAEAPAPLVRVVEVRLGDLPLNVLAQGTVEPRSEATLVAQVGGRIVRAAREFAEGAFFQRGQTLLWIEDADYRLALAQAEAAVAQARVGLEREEAEAELARREWAELGDGDASPLTRREPQLAQARASLAAAEAALEQARLNLARTRIQAPYDGRVSGKQADVGQFVAPGTPLAAVYATDTAEIRVPVPREELAFLDLDLGRGDFGDQGPQVRLSSPATAGPQIWSGRVVRADGGFDPRTRMLGLYVEVADPFDRQGAGGDVLPMGLFVEAEIRGRLAEDVAVLPRAALRDGDRVLVAVEDRLRYRPVEVVRTIGDKVIVGGGLEAGELVCVSNLETVVDGMRVRSQREDAPLETESQREARL
jgi:RND family efflux transporter MFP subunit